MRSSARRLAVVTIGLLVLTATTAVPVAPPALAAGPTSPVLTLSAAGGPATSSLTVQASGFRAGEPVDLAVGTAPVGSGVAGMDGRLPSTRLTVPGSTLPGTLPVTAVGRSSHLTAQASFVVKSDWTQERSDGGHTNGNPFENTITPTTVAGLTQRWKVDAVGLGPVANGYAYTSQAQGIEAVRSPATGALLRETVGARWISGRHQIRYDGFEMLGVDVYSDAVAWRTPIEGRGLATSIIVDGGSVYVVIASERLYKVEGATGRVAWSVPAAANARYLTADATGVYYVSGGRFIGGSVDTPAILHGLSPTTGTERWVQPYATSEGGIPPVAAGGRLFFRDDRSVVALDAATGARLWTTAIDVSLLAYADGRLLVNGLDTTTMSWSSYTTALDVSTGQQLWSHPDGQSATAGGGLVYVPTFNGVTVLDSRTGTKLRTLNLGTGASATSVAIANGTLYVAYNVWAEDQPTLLRSAVRAYALPAVAPSNLLLDDTATAIGYGPGWRVGTNPDNHRGTDHYTDTTGSTATFSFTGTGFRYWFSTAAHHGIAGVSVDGGPETRVDTYTATRSDGRTSWTSPRLPLGRHTVRVRATGERNPAASGRVVTFDRLELGRN